MNKYDGIDSRIVFCVKKFARSLKRKSVFQFIDLEDLEQELMCEALSCVDKFDETRGNFENFLCTILKCRSNNLIKFYMRKKRTGKYQSLSYEQNPGEIFDSKSILEDRIALSQFVKNLTIKHRMLIKLLTSHSITEAAKILGTTYGYINRNIKQIVQLFTMLQDPKNQIGFYKLRSNKMSKNLSTIETLDIKQLSLLPVYDLADLNEQVGILLNHAKELKEKLEDALNLRFSTTIKETMQREHKDTGTTKFVENGFQITAEVPKKVTWDTQKMEEIIKTIPEEHRRSYIKATYSIDERKYAAFSYEYQQLFKPARTITPGKIRYKISIPEEEV